MMDGRMKWLYQGKGQMTKEDNTFENKKFKLKKEDKIQATKLLEEWPYGQMYPYLLASFHRLSVHLRVHFKKMLFVLESQNGVATP